MLTVGGGTDVYVYDAFERRTEKATGSGSLVYLQDLSGNEIAEVNTAGSNFQEDLYVGLRHLAMYANGTTSFFHSDQLGTDRVVTDRSRSVTETCTSLPYGDSDSCAGGTPPVRFAGYDIDRGMGLYRAPARYYSPGLGRPDGFTHTGRSGFSGSDRFMTPDPLNGGVPQTSYPDPAFVALASTLAGHVPTPLALSPLKLDSVPLPQSLGGLVPLPGSGCVGCECSAGGNTLSNPQSLNRYAYVLGNPASLTDPLGTDVSDCLQHCLEIEVGCETLCLMANFEPPPFGEVESYLCITLCERAYGTCLDRCVNGPTGPPSVEF